MALTLSDPRQALIDAMLLMEEEIGASIIWAGQEFPCVAGILSDGKRLDLGGFKLYADAKIKVRTAVFPLGIGQPKPEQTIQFKINSNTDPETFRIYSIDRFWDVAILMHCVHPDQGA